MRRRGGIAIAVLALFLIGLVGCGSGGGARSDAAAANSDAGATAHKATLTKAEWVERGNEVCNDLIDEKSRQMEAFNKAHGISGTPNLRQREAVNAAVVLPNVQERVEGLEALPAPPGEEAKIRAILRSMERGIQEAEAQPENLAKPKQPIPFAESEHLAGAYGLLFCGMP